MATLFVHTANDSQALDSPPVYSTFEVSSTLPDNPSILRSAMAGSSQQNKHIRSNAKGSRM
jgi:hypothetical protein